jgi:serine-type D-Ala-D-Ala carboxypeptidase (penicillin-binding protein 5/6)
MHKKKRLLFPLLMVWLLLAAAGSAAASPEFDFQSKAQLLMDTGSRQILYESNAHEKLYPASVTKVMTMLLAMEALEAGKVALTDLIPVSEKAAAHGGSQIFLSPGDRITFEEMMIGIAVASANDGAWAMAEFLAGSGEAFVEQMNERAAQLGMVNTHFVNPHGLHDDNHYTTAYDVALMSLELLEHPAIHPWLSIWMDEEFLKGKIRKAEGVYLSNSNRIVRYYDGGDGVKTGFTNEAGNCVSASAKREDTRFLAVIMGAPGRPVLFDEARTLLDYGFANWKSIPVAQKGDVLGQLRVDKGAVTKIDVIVPEDVAILVEKGRKGEVEKEVILPEHLPAPLQASAQVGALVIRSAEGEELGRVALVPADDVAKARLMTFFSRCVDQWLRFSRKAS